MAGSELEEQFLCLWVEECCRNNIAIPLPEREVQFYPSRRWRFDFAWPQVKVAVEIEGGTWRSGRHSRGMGMMNDMDKYNVASIEGWKVLRFTNKHLNNPDKVFETVLLAMGAIN